MNDEITVIENHNSQAISTYKKRLKAQKQLHNSSSPLRDLRNDLPRPGTDARPTLDLQYNLIRVQESTFSKIEEESTTRATVGGTTVPNKSTKTLENMLNNCCVLVNIKQFEPKQQATLSKPKPPVPNANSMRRAGSQNIVTDINNEGKLSNSASKEEVPTPGKPKEPDLQEMINLHNQNYKRNRSSSANRKFVEKPKTAETSGRNKNYGERLLAFPHGAINDFEKGKKKGQLLTSFKEMINKNPFKNFGKKRTPDFKEGNAYACECANEKRYKKVIWESTTSCVRSVGWLRNKYSPTAAHAECKAYFEAKVSENPLQPATKDQISKDVIRTFNHNKYLSLESVKKRLERLLECVAVTYPHTGYVQGMNYIAGTLLYHCDEFTSLGVIRILFEQLELKDIFLPSTPCSSRTPGPRQAHRSDRHSDSPRAAGDLRPAEQVQDISRVLLHRLADVPRPQHHSVRILCTLDSPQGQFLDYLLEYGWHYFYRVIIYYLKKLEGPILQARNEEEIMMALKMIKLGKKADGTPCGVVWPEMIEEALYFSIDDTLIDKLNEKKTYKQYFKSCPKSASQAKR